MDDVTAVQLRIIAEIGVAMCEAGASWWLYHDEGQPFLKDGVEAGMWFLERRPDGTNAVPGRWVDRPLPAASFDGSHGRIGDVTAPVTSIEGLLDMKENFAARQHGAPFREKDVGDIALLKELQQRSQRQP